MVNTKGTNRLLERVVIITGGGHGIGKAYAQRLAEEGARIVIAEVNKNAANDVAEKLTQQGFEAMGLYTDVSNEQSLNDMTKQVFEKYGRVDVLINNASIFSTIPISRLPFDQITEDEWDKVMQVNVKGTWLACKAVIPYMKKRASGKIINISSGTAFHGNGGRIHYVTSKAAINGFTRTLAREVGDFNINVNCIAPGNTLSEDNPTEETIKLRESRAHSRALKKIQKPEDLLGAAVFLSSNESDFITGQTLIVDGGGHMI